MIVLIFKIEPKIPSISVDFCVNGEKVRTVPGECVFSRVNGKSAGFKIAWAQESYKCTRAVCMHLITDTLATTWQQTIE